MDRTKQLFGNYDLVKLVGDGGFGKVYMGKHLQSDTEVAIKILDNRLVSREQEAFLREARVIASLDHPSIVRLLDCGIEEGEPFLVMNYAPNGTLRQRHPKGSRLPLQQIITYIKPIASALHYGHERKLIHRDIKPENMLLDSQNEVLLGDFGIALISSSSTSRSTKTVAGTVSYMAPEQIQGKPCIASDQYALGIVVYEWICGTVPFIGSFAEVGQQHLFAIPASFEEQGIDVDPSVEVVVRKALAKNPKERFADVQEFALALEESILQQGTAPTSTPAWSKTEDDVAIFIPSAVGEQKELAIVEKVREPDASPIPVSPITSDRLKRRLSTWRNLISVICVLFLALLAVGMLRSVLPLFASSSIPSSTAKTAILVQPTHISTVQSTIALNPESTTAASNPESTTAASNQGSTTAASNPESTTAVSNQGSTTAASNPESTTAASNQGPTTTASNQGSTTAASNQGSTTTIVTAPVSQSVQRQITANATQSQTVNATGGNTIPAKPAWMTLDVRVVCSTATFKVGDRWDGPIYNGVHLTIVIDSVPEPSIPAASLVEMNAHIDPPGTIGNGLNLNKTYGSYATTGNCSGGDLSWNAQSQAPFVFGQDAQTTTVVQQSDIDNASASLQTALTQSVTDNLQKQIQSNEHLVGSTNCAPVVSADHRAGDQATNVTVSVTVTCTATAST